jgi:hypothetical protein
MESKEMKMISSLLIGLFLVLVITGVIFIGSSYMKNLACTQESTTYTWEDGACMYDDDNNVSTVDVEATVDSLTAIETVEAGINVALGLIGLIILITIFAVVIKTAVGFNKGMN